MYPVMVAAAFNSEHQLDMHIMMLWLNPFLKGLITMHDNKTTLTIYLFKKKVLVKNLTNKMDVGYKIKVKNYLDYIRMANSLKVNNTKLYAAYGFVDPAITGVFCGAIGFVSQFINFDEFYNNADFIPDHSYFNISAKTEINTAESLLRIIKRKIPHNNVRVLSANR
jgi:hypothetical protein